jgi:hypothetical protein
MKRFAIFLLLSFLPLLSSQTSRDEDFGIHTVCHGSRLFVSKVPDFSKMDLKNMKAFFLDRDGKIGEWQALKRGHGKTTHLVKQSGVEVGSYTDLKWQRLLDSEHQVATYEWQWVGANTSESILVQVFEFREDKVFITQQIEAEAHGPGAGADFNPRTNLLTVHSLVFSDKDGHCCPSSLSTVVFRWDGRLLRRISTSKEPIPKDDD